MCRPQLPNPRPLAPAWPARFTGAWPFDGRFVVWTRSDGKPAFSGVAAKAMKPDIFLMAG
jgi:hypothetical protein